MDFRLDEPAWSLLERERRDRPFVVRAGGRVLRFRPATDIGASTLLQVASDWRLFLGFCVVNRDDLAVVDFSWWKAEHLLRLYRRHCGLNVKPEDDRHLFGLLEQEEYREAIEADLPRCYPGADLGELWRSRQWRKLLNFIERLGRNTFFSEVMSKDEELAKRVLNRKKKIGEEEPPPERRMAEFSADTELLTIVADRLGELIAVTAASRGGRMRPPKALPRPKTALQKMRDRADQLHVQFTLDRVFGFVDAQGRPTGTGAKSPTS
jgi:hypothetical protein